MTPEELDLEAALDQLEEWAEECDPIEGALAMSIVRAALVVAAPRTSDVLALAERGLPSAFDVEERDGGDWYATIGPFDRRDGALWCLSLVNKAVDVTRHQLRAASAAPDPAIVLAAERWADHPYNGDERTMLDILKAVNAKRAAVAPPTTEERSK